jgi:hypothetical protein
MYKSEVEIYSDSTNAALMRHPGRRFPGLVIQGDTLQVICQELDEACERIGRGKPGFDECNNIRNSFRSYLSHYRSLLLEHGVELPFSG